MNEQQIRWVEPGVLSYVKANGKAGECRQDWHDVQIELNKYELLSAHRFLSAPRFNSYETEKMERGGRVELSDEGQKNYARLMKARITDAEEPRRMAITGKASLGSAVVNFLPEAEGEFDDQKVREFKEMSVVINATASPNDGTLRAGDDGLKCELWIDTARFEAMVEEIAARHKHVMLEVTFSALLFMPSNGANWMYGRQAYILPSCQTLAILNQVTLVDVRSDSKATDEIASVATKPSAAGGYAIYIVPIAICALLLLFGR